MNQFWLKVVGTQEEEIRRYEKTHVGFPKNKRPRNINPGDRMVLYAVGGSRRVFALADVVSEIYPNKTYPRFPHTVDIRYQLNLPISAGVDIGEISSRNLFSAVRAGHSYLKLTAQEYARAVTKLEKAAGR
ncbi:MAG: EVE domain-containing protein [Pyrinomonadaceae bacterium]|nr:EVE domain-containing protein [Pyrinomonadaceae bacterium]